jgi:hypothetical protein
MPAPGDLTAEALAAVLLVVEEVGGGYALDHEDLGDAPASEENRVGDDVEPATEGECAGLELERAYVDGLAVWRRFLGAGEAEVEHVVTPVRADEVGELDDVLAGLDCRLEVDDGESAGTVRYSTGEVSGVGQAAYWLEVDWDMTEPVSFTGQQYAVVSLRDGIASAVWVQGPLDLTGSGTGFTRSGPDRDLARRLAVVADNKIEALES